MKNMINWFEIPVSDMNRAVAFYETVLDAKLEQMEMMGMKMAFFPGYEGKVSGGLAQSPMHVPSSSGTLVYLNGNPNLSGMLERAEKAGGSIIMPKTAISPEIGYMAFFVDCEGNTIGVHSQE